MLAFFTNTAARVRRDEKGATAVEYGIMVALIAVVVIVAVTLLGGTARDMFGKAACEMQGKTWASPACSTTTGTSGTGGTP